VQGRYKSRPKGRCKCRC